MNDHTTTQLLWRFKEAAVERRITFEPSTVALSHRIREITMLAADAERPRAIKPYADLELGAHVVMMRSLADEPDVSPDVRSWTPLSTPRALPAVWEPA